MSQETVLYGEDGSQGVDVFQEERVVTHTEAHQYIEVTSFFIQDFRLGDGIAHGFVLPGVHLFAVANADFLFGNPTSLAADRYNLEPAAFQ